MLISQMLWGSIGWSVGKFRAMCCRMNILYMVDSGSSLGAALAAREKGCNRVILFVGEGSL